MPRNSRAGKRPSASAQRELESPERKKVCLSTGESAVPAGRDAELQRAPHRKESANSEDGGTSEIAPESVPGSTSGGDRSRCNTLSGSAGFAVAANEHKSTIAAAPAPLSGIPASSGAAAAGTSSSSPASVLSAYRHPSRNSGNPQSRSENAALLLPAPDVGTSIGRAGVDSSSDAVMSHASRWQLVTPRLHSIGGFGRGAEAQGGSLSSANAAPARESVAEGGFGQGAEARGGSLSSANAAPARESVAEVRFSRLGSSISTGPLATWVDSVMSFAMLIGVIIVCNNFLSLIFFFVLYNHLCDANVDMIMLMRGENSWKCALRIGSRFLLVMLFLYASCMDGATPLPAEAEAGQTNHSEPWATWLLRWVGFQKATGQHLLSHLLLDDLQVECSELTGVGKAHADGLCETCKTTRALSYGDLLRVLALGDVLVCYLGQFFKAVSLKLAQRCIVPPRLGYLLELEEAFLSLYRQLLPAAMWLRALRSSSTWAPLALLFACAYILIKVKTWLRTARLAFVALIALTHNRLPYGTLIAEDGRRDCCGECAICRDELQKPVKLSCGHIFCDSCVVNWLEVTMLDGTCPLCRRVFLPAHLHMSLKGGSWLFPHLV